MHIGLRTTNYTPAVPCPPARRLLAHPDPGVRARTCNLVGNMCRYSGYFYAQLAAQGLLPPLIERCRDEDRSTRKFACFAIGNAGFHSAALYESLRPAVRALVALLADPEDKTRANAAGALGNLVSGAGHGGRVWQRLDVMLAQIWLWCVHCSQGASASWQMSWAGQFLVLQAPRSAQTLSAIPCTHTLPSPPPLHPVQVRNSNALCGELFQAGAVEALMQLAATADRPAGGRPAAGAGEGGSPQKIALFSLGNMCAHRECREVLQAGGIAQLMRALQASPDPVVQKYLGRMQAKLAGGGSGGGAPTASNGYAHR
jgi:hypothetical protein